MPQQRLIGTSTSQVPTNGMLGTLAFMNAANAAFPAPVSISLGSAAAPSIAFTGDPNTGIYSPGADQLAISTNGTQRINIEADGDINIDSGGVFYDATNNRLAIGTTSPSTLLHVTTPFNTNGTVESVALLVNNSPSIAGAGAKIHLGSVNGLTRGVALSGINTGGVNNAHSMVFEVSSESSAPTERMRIDSSGRLLVGTSTARNFNNGVTTPRLQLEGLDVSQATFSLARNSANSGGPVIGYGKSRGTVAGSMTAVLQNDDLGRIQFQGADGTQLQQAAEISAHVDGTPGTNDMPGRLVFSTTADGAISPTERMRIESSGRVGIGTTSPECILSIDKNSAVDFSSNANLRATASLTLGNTNQAITAIAFKSATGNWDKYLCWDNLGGTQAFSVGYLNNATTRLDLLRITNQGEAIFARAAGESARIDSSGRLLVGTSTSVDFGGASATAQFVNTDSDYAVGLLRAFNGVSGPIQAFRKTRSSAINGVTLVSNGDVLGVLSFRGTDGTTAIEGAAITAFVDGTPGANDMPGRLVFSTTADGASSPTERMRITSAGNVGIGTSGPGAKLQVATGTNNYTSTANTLGVVGPDSTGLYIGTHYDGSGAGADIVSRGYSATMGDFRFIAANGSYASFATRMVIDGSGRVGIGTASASTPLHIGGATDKSIRIDSSTSNAAFIGIYQNETQLTVNRDGATGTFADAGKSAATLILEGANGGSSIRFATALANNTTPGERARIDSSGRLLVGTSTSAGYAHQFQVRNDSGAVAQCFTSSASTGGSYFNLSKSRGTAGSPAVVISGDELGTFQFDGYSGASGVYVPGARIQAFVDGEPDTSGDATDMPGRLVFSTTENGAAVPAERFRITNDGVIAHDQPAPAAVNATATLTVANLKAGIITSTSAAATDMTLPTGTDTQAGFSGTYDNFTFEWSVINTGPSLVRVLAGTAHIVVGSGSVATGTSGRFATRRTAANTFTSYRLS
jgi:hypothetical protein